MFLQLYLGIVLVVVVLITSFFLYAQKAKSERIMEGFAKMLPQNASVLRNGQVKNIRVSSYNAELQVAIRLAWK